MNSRIGTTYHPCISTSKRNSRNHAVNHWAMSFKNIDRFGMVLYADTTWPILNITLDWHLHKKLSPFTRWIIWSRNNATCMYWHGLDVTIISSVMNLETSVVAIIVSTESWMTKSIYLPGCCLVSMMATSVMSTFSISNFYLFTIDAGSTYISDNWRERDLLHNVRVTKRRFIVGALWQSEGTSIQSWKDALNGSSSCAVESWTSCWCFSVEARREGTWHKTCDMVCIDCRRSSPCVILS